MKSARLKLLDFDTKLNLCKKDTSSYVQKKKQKKIIIRI